MERCGVVVWCGVMWYSVMCVVKCLVVPAGSQVRCGGIVMWCGVVWCDGHGRWRDVG